MILVLKRSLQLSLLAAASLLLLGSSKSLNQGYLVPSGKTRIDQKLLSDELKICALTFDDGPDARYTMQVHDILREQGIRATFFVIGRNVDRYPEQVIALAEYGHEIGNHSYTHRDFLSLSRADMLEEIQSTAAMLDKLGISCNWFRPPYGSFNRTVVNVAADQGLDTMLWSVDPQDWMRPGSAVVQRRVTSRSGPGAVVLLHSTVKDTLDALPAIIEDFRNRGYTFVTASEWQQLVSGSASLDTLRPQSDYTLPLHLPDPSKAGIDRGGDRPLPGSGTVNGSLHSDSQIWQRVPAGNPGESERRLTVYSNFVDDNDLRRVLSDGRSRNLMEADGTVGSGLLRVLDGLPPQQIVAIVDGVYPSDSVEVQVEDTRVVQGNDIVASTAAPAVAAGGELQQAAAGLPLAQPAVPEDDSGQPVSIADSSALSMNLASPDFAAGVEASDDARFIFLSYAGSPSDTDWDNLEQYMQLCGLTGFGYPDGYSSGRAPEEFPFEDDSGREGRRRLELGMFSPADFLREYAAGGQWFIPLRSTDFARLGNESLFSGVSNGYREFMLIRQFSMGMDSVEQVDLAGLPADAVALRIEGRDRKSLLIASPRPGISLDVPGGYEGWQLVQVDGNGRLKTVPVEGQVQADGRLLVLVEEGGD